MALSGKSMRYVTKKGMCMVHASPEPCCHLCGPYLDYTTNIHNGNNNNNKTVYEGRFQACDGGYQLV